MSLAPEENPYLPPAAPPLAPGAIPMGAGIHGERLSDTRILGKVVIGLIAAQVLCRSLAYFLLYTLRSHSFGKPTTPLIVLLAVGALLIFVGAVVVYCIWLYRTAVNAQRIQGRPLDTSPGMSVGCYFIPFYNLFGPITGMRGIVQATFRDHPERSPMGLVTPWWLCYIGAFLVAKITSTSEDPRTIIADIVVWDIAALLICAIIAKLSQMQSEAVIRVYTPKRLE